MCLCIHILHVWGDRRALAVYETMVLGGKGHHRLVGVFSHSKVIRDKKKKNRYVQGASKKNDT